jgi:hypothetical protein
MTKEIVRQLDYIFKARSVAVIGASNTPPKWRYMRETKLAHAPLSGVSYYMRVIYEDRNRERGRWPLDC